MAVKGRRHLDFQPWVVFGDRADQRREITLHVQAECEEVRKNDQPGDAGGNEFRGRSRQIGLAEFEEGGADLAAAGCRHKSTGYRANRLIGRFHAGTMGKYDNSSAQTLPIYARMWLSSSVFCASS